VLEFFHVTQNQRRVNFCKGAAKLASVLQDIPSIMLGVAIGPHRKQEATDSIRNLARIDGFLYLGNVRQQTSVRLPGARMTP
jgi:hypothetical protein